MQLDAESEVNNEMANRMSLFYAEATPMLKTLSSATTKFVSEVSHETSWDIFASPKRKRLRLRTSEMHQGCRSSGEGGGLLRV